MTTSQPTASQSDLLRRHFQSLLDLVPDGIYISDAKGETLFVNSPYQRLTGVSAERVMGRNVVELVENGVFSTVVNPPVVATGQAATLVQEVNGRKVVLSGHPVFDRDGKVDLVVTFVRDITAFDRLKEEIAAQKALLDYYQRQVSTLNPEDVFQDDGMVAVSQPSMELLRAVDKIAPTDAAVLILGETGVGKDIVARRIHQKSRRAEARFLKVDCSALPETLIESELFGYVPGAFSGAHAKGKAGFFEKADGGSLFLDEIGELSQTMQTKLLRALQDQEIMRVGSTAVTPINVRIIAATNRNLEEAVARGTFRSDLYYRLKVAVIRILPLRERKDDILPLVKIFLRRFNEKYQKSVSLSSKAENLLLNHGWPGNVRELENLIHSVVITATKPRVACKDLPSGLSARGSYGGAGPVLQSLEMGGGRPLKEIVADIERDLIEEALAIYGSVAKVAEVLKVDRSTIFRKTRTPPAPGDARRRRASRPLRNQGG